MLAAASGISTSDRPDSVPINSCFVLVTVATLLVFPVSAQSPIGDEEIRSAFVGKAACPPQPWPVGFGPFEFRADGAFVRIQDTGSLYGRYTIADGRICVTLSDSSAPSFCLDVLKDGTQYFLRDLSPPLPATPPGPFPVTPCPLPSAAR
jgi:hypothetical protein